MGEDFLAMELELLLLDGIKGRGGIPPRVATAGAVHWRALLSLLVWTTGCPGRTRGNGRSPGARLDGTWWPQLRTTRLPQLGLTTKGAGCGAQR